MSILALMASTPRTRTDGAPLPAPPTDTTNQVLFPTGTPTPQEQKRLYFQATMKGSYQVLPGQFSTQARQYALLGTGTSTMFLHGSQQTRIVIPNDAASPITGFMTLVDRNINNGAQLGLRLTAVPGAVDARGRPTHFTYRVDQIVSAGTFAGALGDGTVQIVWGSARHPGQGSASVLVRGRVYASGTTNLMVNGSIDG